MEVFLRNCEIKHLMFYGCSRITFKTIELIDELKSELKEIGFTIPFEEFNIVVWNRIINRNKEMYYYIPSFNPSTIDSSSSTMDSAITAISNCRNICENISNSLKISENGITRMINIYSTFPEWIDFIENPELSLNHTMDILNSSEKWDKSILFQRLSVPCISSGSNMKSRNNLDIFSTLIIENMPDHFKVT